MLAADERVAEELVDARSGDERDLRMFGRGSHLATDDGGSKYEGDGGATFERRREW